MIDAKSYFLAGIGGSGMMPLALILSGRGATVAGSDRTLDQGRLAPKFEWLRAQGIALFPQDGSGPQAGQTMVASAAIEPTVPDMVRAAELGLPRLSRAELLAGLFNASTLPIGIAGTSGKSTVTGMIGWICHALGLDPTVMNGAVMKNFAGPDAPFASALVGAGEAFISEVDESDGSIALYRPAIAVLNNVSLDHKSMEELRTLFGGFIAEAAWVIVNGDDPEAMVLLKACAPDLFITFSVGGVPTPSGFVATNIAEEPFAVSFDLISGTLPAGRVTLQVPGRHNVSNALAALAATSAAGIPLHDAIEALARFTGLRRRFELVGEVNKIAVIDDFGHNPDKIAATLDTLHAFAGRLLVLFQPHGYGPLKVMRHELVAMFAQKLGAEDVLVLPDPVYLGGTTNRAVTSADIVADITASGGTALHVADRRDAARHLAAQARPGDRIVVMGARDDTLSALAEDILADIGRIDDALLNG